MTLKTTKLLSLSAFVAFGLMCPLGLYGQSATPTPTPSGDEIGGYQITSSVEVGARGMIVNGSDSKYRSDLNYRPGFRIFDSSFMVENMDGKIFDSALITSTGWGGDPSGIFRSSIEKTGIYRFDANVRRVKYFNDLNNHALGQHGANTKHNFGDFDLTIFPERNFKFHAGYSYNRTSGPAGFTTRAYRDEFGVSSDVDNGSDDLRLGVDGKVAGFNLGLTYGYRRFRERTNYFIDELNLGNAPSDTARLFTFERIYPIDGSTNYVNFHVQRTFAEKLDFTGRFIYSQTETDFSLNETLTGRDNTNNWVDLDRFLISGDASRPQVRTDLGVTWRVTDAFRISNTFTYDQFSISGGNTFFEELQRRNAAGTPLPTVFTNTLAYRVTGYKRATNLIEADYQVNTRLGFSLGYRFTDRNVRINGFDRNLANTTPGDFDEEFDNNTHSFIASLKGKPMKNWVIFANLEHGEADNSFTRLANYDLTTFKLRSQTRFNKWSLNASVILRNNDNPGNFEDVAIQNFAASSKSTTFTSSVDWEPLSQLSLSTGYTYQHLTAETIVRVPVSGQLRTGLSEYYVRDSFFFFDVTAQPIKRVSLFASYRINDDQGQGNRFATVPENLITSYPMQLQSPEIRLAIRLHRNVDWNIGYQYFNYREEFVNAQNYNAHLPYTSLRFFFGRSADR